MLRVFLFFFFNYLSGRLLFCVKENTCCFSSHFKARLWFKSTEIRVGCEAFAGRLCAGWEELVGLCL